MLTKVQIKYYDSLYMSMRSRLRPRRAPEAGAQTAADDAANRARTQEALLQQDARRKANEAEICKLAGSVAVLLEPPSAANTGSQDIEAARRRFRAPIERVEAVARERFMAVAAEVGTSTVEPRHGYFAFLPRGNSNTTKPIPLVNTDAGTLAVQLGTAWFLNAAKYGHKMRSEAAFSASVVRIDDDERKKPEEIGYVRLGRIFRRDDLPSRVTTHGSGADVSAVKAGLYWDAKPLSKMIMPDLFVGILSQKLKPLC